MSRITTTSTVSSTKKRLAILSMAVCIALSGAFAASGCGVRSGMERVDEAKQAKEAGREAAAQAREAVE